MSGEPIVVGTDGSTTAEAAVDKAAELAEALGCPLHLVSAYTPTTAWMPATGGIAMAEVVSTESALAVAEQAVDHCRSRLADRELEVQTHVCCGEPAHSLVALADELGAQMIVVGNRGMSGARRVLGSVPNRVSHHSSCAVLIVHTS